jgi:hypothetical protein
MHSMIKLTELSIIDVTVGKSILLADRLQRIEQTYRQGIKRQI